MSTSCFGYFPDRSQKSFDSSIYWPSRRERSSTATYANIFPKNYFRWDVRFFVRRHTRPWTSKIWLNHSYDYYLSITSGSCNGFSFWVWFRTSWYLVSRFNWYGNTDDHIFALHWSIWLEQDNNEGIDKARSRLKRVSYRLGHKKAQQSSASISKAKHSFRTRINLRGRIWLY